jgi:branched-chain amino acid transport system substrate-binding protein
VKKLLFLSAVLCLFTYAASAADAIKIGLLQPMTGSTASEGQEAKQVVELLAAEINAKGGVLGRQIQVITEDDAGDPRTAGLAAQKLVSQGVVAIVGTYGSSVTEPTESIFNEAGIPQVATGSTAIRLTAKGYKTFFRTCPRDDEQAKVGAQSIQKLGFKKVAILHDNSTYAKGLADETKGLLEKMPGMKIVYFDAIVPTESDFSTVLTKLKQAGPDVVFFTGYYQQGGLLLRQKKEMGFNVPFMGGDATNNPDLVKGAGVAAAAGFYFLSSPLPKDLPEAKPFLARYQAKYKSQLSSIYAAFAGDGFSVIAEAIKGTKGTNGAQLANYLHTSLKDFPGMTGKISFDAKGDRVAGGYRLYKVDAKGDFVLQPDTAAAPAKPAAKPAAKPKPKPKA